MTLPGSRYQRLKLTTGEIVPAEKSLELSRNGPRVCRRCGTKLSSYNRAKDLCFRCCNILAMGD